MTFRPKITIREAAFVLGVIVSGIAVIYAMKGQIAATAQTAEQAQKLSEENTKQISDLNKAVNKLTTAIVKQNETVRWQYQIQKNELGHLKERMDGFDRRTGP